MRTFRLTGLALLAAGAFAMIEPAALAGANLKPQSSTVLGVTLKVVPRALPADGKSWVFDLTFDTHTRELSDELTGNAVLIADGKRHAPSAWQGDAPGGHHRKGSLHFAPIAPPPMSVELQIQRPGETAPRSFRWSLQ